MTSKADVIVIGAGFTGLSAVAALRERGLSCLLLEARDRVGGRVEANANSLGELVDTGGQFLCDDMPNVMALARKHGKTLVPTPVDGRFIVQPAMGEAVAERLLTRSMAIRERVNAYAPRDPSIAGLSVGAWLAAQPDDPDAKAAFGAMIEGLWCLGIDELPLWYLVSNDRRVTNEVSELQYFLRETMHSLAADMASDMGGSLRLATQAMRLERSADGVAVAARSGAREVLLSAKAVLVALPPATASKLDHAPALPPALRRALSVWQSGAVIKALVRYSRAFWRDAGMSGTVFWRDPQGIYACDASPDGDHPALVVFIGGRLALKWRKNSPEQLRGEVLRHLSAALGPRAAEPLDVTFRDWSGDRWSGGAYSDLVVDMNATDAEDLLRTGAPPVHFASSELSPSFPGYIEGALVAGRIAAEKIAAELKDNQSPMATSASGS